jgi:hypothetical protein
VIELDLEVIEFDVHAIKPECRLRAAKGKCKERDGSRAARTDEGEAVAACNGEHSTDYVARVKYCCVNVVCAKKPCNVRAEPNLRRGTTRGEALKRLGKNTRKASKKLSCDALAVSVAGHRNIVGATWCANRAIRADVLTEVYVRARQGTDCR